MGTSDVYKVLKIAWSTYECYLRTLKTLRVTIYHEMHEWSCNFLFIIFSTKLQKNPFLVRTSVSNICNFLLRSLCLYSSSLVLNFLLFAHFPQTFNHICVDFVVFLFLAFSFSWSKTILLDKANRLSAILPFVFKFRASAIVSIATL